MIVGALAMALAMLAGGSLLLHRSALNQWGQRLIGCVLIAGTPWLLIAAMKLCNLT